MSLSPLCRQRETQPERSAYSTNTKVETATIPKLEHQGPRNKTDQNTILLMREYLLNSLYILNESYVRVNMFKALKIGLDAFCE
jgi:hypothetical protein